MKFDSQTSPRKCILPNWQRLHQEGKWWHWSPERGTGTQASSWRLMDELLKFYCDLSSEIEVFSSQQRHLYGEKKFGWFANWVKCIESSGWRLLQEWKWWHCCTDKLPRLQQGCLLAFQWGPTRFWRRIYWWSCNNFYSVGLCIQPQSWAVDAATELKQINIMFSGRLHTCRLG